MQAAFSGRSAAFTSSVRRAPVPPALVLVMTGRVVGVSVRPYLPLRSYLSILKSLMTPAAWPGHPNATARCAGIAVDVKGNVFVSRRDEGVVTMRGPGATEASP